jgi:hypothetical protein
MPDFGFGQRMGSFFHRGPLGAAAHDLKLCTPRRLAGTGYRPSRRTLAVCSGRSQDRISTHDQGEVKGFPKIHRPIVWFPKKRAQLATPSSKYPHKRHDEPQERNSKRRDDSPDLECANVDLTPAHDKSSCYKVMQCLFFSAGCNCGHADRPQRINGVEERLRKGTAQ